MTQTIDFVCVGGQKCGTTLLHAILMQNEHLRLPQHRKELDYYSFNYWRGPAWRDSYYPERPSGTQTLMGDICPSYLEHPGAARRIHAENPNAKIILIVRNPRDRFISNYLHDLRIGAFKGGIERYYSEMPRAILASCYSRFFNDYLQLFGSQNCYILVFEELVADIPKSLEQLCAFLGVLYKPPLLNQGRIHNEGFVPQRSMLYVTARKVGQAMRRLRLDSVVERTKNSFNMKTLFGASPEATKDPLLALSKEDSEYVNTIVRQESNWVASIQNRPTPTWI